MQAKGPRHRAKEQPYIASMGIYVAKASAIRDLLLNHFPEVGSHFCVYILDIEDYLQYFWRQYLRIFCQCQQAAEQGYCKPQPSPKCRRTTLEARSSQEQKTWACTFKPTCMMATGRI